MRTEERKWTIRSQQRTFLISKCVCFHQNKYLVKTRFTWPLVEPTKFCQFNADWFFFSWNTVPEALLFEPQRYKKTVLSLTQLSYLLASPVIPSKTRRYTISFFNVIHGKKTAVASFQSRLGILLFYLVHCRFFVHLNMCNFSTSSHLVG